MHTNLINFKEFFVCFFVDNMKSKKILSINLLIYKPISYSRINFLTNNDDNIDLRNKKRREKKSMLFMYVPINF